MNKKQKWHWFKFVYYGVFTLFMGLMGYVTYLAYVHPSGSLGIDVSKMQQLRYESIASHKALYRSHEIAEK